jgi:SAM-dependent MidA family methyltransferase
MILLISSLAKAQDLAQALQEATTEPVQVCAAFAETIANLQTQEFSAVIFDQLLLDVDPDRGEAARKHLGTAVPVYVNLAVNGSARVVRELRSALQRRQREILAARKDAEHALRHEMSDTVTALLLSCELALQVPNLPASAETRMQTVDALAKEMSAKLGAMA